MQLTICIHLYTYSFLFSEEENLFIEETPAHAVNRTLLRPNVPHFD